MGKHFLALSSKRAFLPEVASKEITKALDVHQAKPSAPRILPKLSPMIKQERPKVALEICCGHAGLTSALYEVGFNAKGVDWKGNKHKSRMPILLADLTAPNGQAYVRSLFQKYNVVYVHMAPPCGTMSRARERRVPKHLVASGAPDPQPLRSVDHPEGLPGLSEFDQMKVGKANILASFCADLAKFCLDKEIGFTIENPRNSYLWQLQSMKPLVRHQQTRTTPFQACMWGSRRDKWTSILSNMKEMETLHRVCDGKHEHLPWGTQWKQGWCFATAEECEYPLSFAKQLLNGQHYIVRFQTLHNRPCENKSKPVSPRLPL